MMSAETESTVPCLGCYVSHLLAERLGADSFCENGPTDEFEGAIFFGDVVNSTAITARFDALGQRGAEELAVRLSRFFGGIFETVVAFGGDVLRLDGDAVIALWRAQPTLEGAVRAAAGAAMLLKDHQVEAWAGDNLLLRQRITLAAGPLRAIRIDTAPDRAFLVLSGAPIQMLAKPAARSAPGTVVVSDRTAALLGSSAQLIPGPDGTARLAGLSVLPPAVSASATVSPFPDDLAARIRAFLPRVLVERIEAGHADWIAEFRTVTLVYVSLSSVSCGSQSYGEWLKEATHEVGRAVRPLGAAVWDVINGDKGVVVTVAFGLPPYTRENNAVWAVQAAWQIRAAFASVDQRCAVGVATGRVFCGVVGSKQRREYLSTGPVMSLAARLMQAAGNDIICDEHTACAANGHFTFADAESIFVRGHTAPVRIYRVVGPSTAGTHARVGATGLVGRESEIRAIETQLDRLCREGIGGLVAIEAEAGAGKSSLLTQAREMAVARKCTVIVATAEALEQGSPYSVMRQILPQLLWPKQFHDLDRDLLHQRLVEVLRGAPLEAQAALLEDIMPLGLGDAEPAADVTGQGRISGISELVAHITKAATRWGACVLLLDDLQWIDASSAQILMAVVRRVPALLVLTASRSLEPEEPPHPRMLLQGALMVIALPRLGQDKTTAIVCRQLGVTSLPPRLAEYAQARSEGLPLHAEQLALSLRDQNAVVVTGGRCRLTGADLNAVPMPETLRGVVFSRIDMLGAEQQLTLKVASVVGRSFDPNIIRRIHPFGEKLADLGLILESLVQAALLDLSDGGTYSFKHATIRDAAYDLLTFAQRRPLHRRIAEILEETHRGELEPRYAELALHWECAEEPDRAADYHQRAAAFALHRYANHEALVHAERIEGLRSRLRESFEPSRRAALARICGDACHELSRFADAERFFAECANLNCIPVPVTRIGMAIRLAAGTAQQAVARLGISPICRTADRDALAAHIFLRLAEHAYFGSDALKVCHFTLASLNRAERAGAIPELVEGFGGLAIGLASAGQARLARFYRQRSLKLAREKGSLHDQGFSNLLAAASAFGLGDWAIAITCCNAGAQMYQRLGDRFREQSCRVVLGYAYLATAEYASAEQTFAAYGENSEEIENIPARAWLLAGRAALDMILGRSPSVALTRLAAARDDTLHRAERLLCDGIQAAAHLQNGDTTAASQSATAALDSILNSPPTMAIAYFSASAAAEVAVALAERFRLSTGLMEDARRAGRALSRCAARIPICRPRASWLRGRIAMLEGRRSRARKYWLYGLNEANRLGMKLEQALITQTMMALPPKPSIVDATESAGALRSLGAAPWLHPPSYGAANRVEEPWASQTDGQLVRGENLDG